jgi:hypothetical protein
MFGRSLRPFLAVLAAGAANHPLPNGLLEDAHGLEVSADGAIRWPNASPARTFGPLSLDTPQNLRQAVPNARPPFGTSSDGSPVFNALPQLGAMVTQPDPNAPTTPPPVTEAPTPDPAATTAPPPPAGVGAIVIEPVDSTPPPPDHPDERMADFNKEFEDNDPLLERTIWGDVGIPIVVTAGIVCVLMIIALLVSQNSDEVEETELELPENMYGETFATVIMASHKFNRDGGKTLPVICELFSSIVLLGVTYMLIYIMIGVAQNTIDSVDQDVEERDSLFEKFRDPVLWQAQNWELYPDSVWRRDSMVWFCHDIIYGKAKHVNELGPIWYMFSWVVLVIWFSYMLFEMRECFKLKLMIWNSPTVPAQDMVTTNKEEGKIMVNGLSMGVKGIVTLIILLPKLALNLVVAYIGCVFLLYNDLDDDLQEVLLKTIEMAFILEMDELVFEAFASTPKKQQLSQIEMPPVVEKGLWRTLSLYGEFPRFMICIGLASYLSIKINTDEHSRATLTPKQAGVIEGCCNFMQYLKGAGHKVPLADGNPCSSFREGYEGSMGIDDAGGILPPGEHPLNGTINAAGGVVGGDAAAQAVGPVALLHLGAQLLWHHGSHYAAHATHALR